MNAVRFIIIFTVIFCSLAQTACSSQEKQANTLYNQVLNLKREGRYTDALNIGRKIVAKYPVAAISGKANEMIDTLGEKIAVEKANPLYNKAVTLMREEKYLDALRICRELVEKYPKVPISIEANKEIAMLEEKAASKLYKIVIKLLKTGSHSRLDDIIANCKILASEFPSQNNKKADAKTLLSYLDNNRFELRPDSTVFDSKNNLQWFREGTMHTKSAYSWHDEFKYCNELNYAGYTDWRMPTLDEMKTLLIAKQVLNGSGQKLYLHPFFFNNPSLQGCRYWTGTKRDNERGGHWHVVDFSTGKISALRSNDWPGARVFPVRDADPSGTYQGRSTKEWLTDLRNGAYDQQVAAARALGKIYPAPTETVPELIAIMAKEIKACANSVNNSQEIQECKLQLFEEVGDTVREMGTAAYPRVCEALEAADLETRMVAILPLSNDFDQSIPQNKLQKARRTAMDALNDSRWLIRLLGVNILNNIFPNENTLLRLQEFLKSEEHPDVREKAERIVKGMEKKLKRKKLP